MIYHLTFEQEKYRRYKELSAAEKVVLNSGRFFLSNKFSRIFLFFYSLLLHILVFATLYKIAHTTTEIHDDSKIWSCNSSTQ